MSWFIERLETVLAAAASGRLPLIHQQMPRHQAVWLRHAAGWGASVAVGWEQQCRTFVEENYARICTLLPATANKGPADILDRAIALKLGAAQPGSFQDKLIAAAIVSADEFRPARYAMEIGLLSSDGDHLVLSPAGKVVRDLVGLERVRLLLALELCQSRGVDDRWRVSKVLAQHVCYKRWSYDPQDPWDESGDEACHTLWRLTALGVISGHDDDPRSTFSPTPVTPLILGPLITEEDGPIIHLARALLADEQTRAFGDPTGQTATEAATGQARMIAHEVRNRLIPMRMALARLAATAMSNASGAPADDLQRLAAGLDRIESFVDEMAETARLVGHAGTFSLAKAIRQAIDDAASQMDHRATFDATADTLHVEGDRPAFVASLLNMLRNAWQIQGDATVVIRLAPSVDGRRIRVLIDDDGPGVPENARSAIFQDGVGFRTGGSGLGLAFARRTIEDMRGRLSCEANPGGGARFVVDLPIAGVDA